MIKNQAKFAKKDLGQNFLTSTKFRDQILEEAGDISGQEILEVGPGLGFLTEALIDAKARLTAVELDNRVYPILTKKFAQYINRPVDEAPSFTLVEGSILHEDLDQRYEQKKYSVIANIPYHITSPIIRKLLSETRNKPQQTILMVQKEVAEKICPKIKKGKQKRSILSISVEIYATAKLCFVVGREHFDPSPKVDSAIIKLVTRETPLVPADMETDFFTVVNAGFHEKRKKLGNSIGKYFGVSPSLLMGTVNENLRAEDLTIEDWIEITKNFQKNVKV
ncbi:ribosomal RNA small subunit methyltransferase A [bacterium DOLZORAL124_38_8]|nr:MAG: ribosomal RNA small subunit methyltransferase A [bacterium DOLZORAL124_38_8]